MKEKIIFTNGLIDLAQPRLGTKIIFKTDDFFGVAQHPTASLDITGSTANDDGSQLITGNITIKGVTQPISFTMSFKGNYATAALNIDRTKFGIRYGSGSFFDNLGDKAINDEFQIRAKLEL